MHGVIDRNVPVNYSLLTGTVPVNYSLLTGTVPVNYSLLTGTGILFIFYRFFNSFNFFKNFLEEVVDGCVDESMRTSHGFGLSLILFPV